jgi:hypothetical protein
MALFVLGSDITIGNFHFSGVHDIVIKKSLHNISDIATIKLPSIARVLTKGTAYASKVITGTEFKEGDAVNINLGYNGEMANEFSGFVTRCNLNIPLEIECEGYSWLLRRHALSGFQKAVTVKQILENAISGIDPEHKITIRCDVDYPLSNVEYGTSNSFDVISNISKYSDGCLSCFFIRPDVLWCGLIYSPYAHGTDVLNAGSINYHIGFNTLKSNSLKLRMLANDPVMVQYSKKLSGGQRISEASDVFRIFLRTRNKILNQVSNRDALKAFADEKAYRLNYAGYEGSIKTFLQPFAAPGYTAFIIDSRYPGQSGSYLVESVETHFGINGARRIVEIGPKSGFAKA